EPGLLRSVPSSRKRLSERYGPVYTIHLGPQPYVVLCGYHAVKEALVDQAEEFSAPVLHFFFTPPSGIVFTNGEKWKALRRFALQTLRNFGMGKRSLEERIQEEAQCLVQELAQTQATPFDPTFLISCAVSNVICSIVFGDRFDYKDGDFLTLVGLINQIFQLLSSPWAQMYNLFPGPMSYLPGHHNRIFENFEQLRLFVCERVKMHQESFDRHCPRDFIDCFLLRMEQENQDPLSYFHMETLVMTTPNLFFTGTEMVSTTLRYGFLILMKYPQIQAEIDTVIGWHRRPLIEDRMHMPYSDAVIHEIQRISDIVRGFLLPNGTNVIPLLFSVHNDPTQFKDPVMFNPANFLDERGSFQKNDALPAFSAGKRLCLGESLARMELFLFFTTALQLFALKPLDIGNAPRPCEFRAIPR
uniref:Uncharacterized protein n=1 Tax=Pelusios castaneus TaxID=367368 RepID=A0A8C8SG86_9SAUR